jgi:hypothetical protein
MIAPVTAAPRSLDRRLRAAASTLAGLRWRGALPLLFFVVAALLFFKLAWGSPTTTNIGDGGDPTLSVWFLRWTAYAVTHFVNPLFTTRLNHPYGVNLMWNTAVLFPGLLLTPITLTLGPVFAYNVLVTASIALSGWCCYLLIKRFVPLWPAALLGGVIYAFGPYMAPQSQGHAQLISGYFPPLVALILHDLLVRRSRSPRWCGTALGLLCAAQVLTGEEVFTSTVVIAAVMLVLLAATHREQVGAATRRAAAALPSLLISFLVIAGPAIVFQLFGPQRVSGAIQPADVYVSDLFNLVIPTGAQQLQPQGGAELAQGWTGGVNEWNGYIGVLLLALLAVVAVRRWRLPVVRIAVLTGLVAVLLSLGPELHVAGHRTGIILPWRLIDGLPVVSSMQPNRLMLYADLAVAFLAAFAVEMMSLARGRFRLLPAVAVTALAAVPLLPVVPNPAATVEVPAFFTDGAVQRVVPADTVVLLLPYSDAFRPMLWQAQAGLEFQRPGGYAYTSDANGHAVLGSPHSTLTDTLSAIEGGQHIPVTADLRTRMLGDMTALGVQAVVLGPTDHQSDVEGAVTALLGHPPDAIDGVLLWRDARPS